MFLHKTVLYINRFICGKGEKGKKEKKKSFVALVGKEEQRHVVYWNMLVAFQQLAHS